ncbi:unnamed protein product [Prorocentrum cordatum]|uniref:Major facilitator superfamily (MFS) profile domain-containing protein n=1 Tax=Prorocentrum cordatum TaxID=2364126 RepID=A0ABN9QSR9_9DINO|nr:unnamed protein product [Polarella glacialis]
MPTQSTWLAVASIAGNYGARALTPMLAHIVCVGARCDAAALVGATAGAFFAGDLVAQLVAKALVQRFSGGALLVAGTAGWALLALGIMPLALPDPLLVLVPAQFALGFFCGLGYPAAHAVLASTVPAATRTTAVTLVSGAAALGTIRVTSARRRPPRPSARGALRPLRCRRPADIGALPAAPAMRARARPAGRRQRDARHAAGGGDLGPGPLFPPRQSPRWSLGCGRSGSRTPSSSPSCPPSSSRHSRPVSWSSGG